MQGKIPLSMMPSETSTQSTPRAVILAAKVLQGNRRVPALRQSLIDAGWLVETYVMGPVPDGVAAQALGGPGRRERWMDRISRLGPVGRALAGQMQQYDRQHYAADRRARYFSELQDHSSVFHSPSLVIAHDSFAAEWAAENLQLEIPLVADLVEDIEARSYTVVDAPAPELLVQRPEAILTISEGMKRRLISLGAPADHVSVVMNAMPRSAVASAINTQPVIDLVSAGTLYPGDGVDYLVRLAGLCGLSLVIVGSCPDPAYRRRLEALIAQTGSSFIVWHGAVTPMELADHVRSARALVLGYTPDRSNFLHAMPNRLFSALAAGTPVLAQKGLNAASWIEARGVGAAIDLRDAASAAQSLKAALDEGVRNRFAEAALRVAREISWETQSEAFLATISALQGARSMTGRDGD